MAETPGLTIKEMNSTEENSPALRSGPAGKDFFFYTVLTLSLFLSITFIPFAGIFFGVLTPLPTVLAVVRFGIRSAWLIPAGAGAVGTLILFALGVVQFAPFLIMLLCVGAVMGYGMGREWTAARVVGISALILVVLVYVDTGGELSHVIEQELQEMISTMQQYSSQSADLQAMESSLLAIVPLFVSIVPGMAVSSALWIPWLNLLAARRYCSRMGVEICVRENLKCWKAPEMLVWPVIASGLMLLLPFGKVQIAALNLLIVFGSIYFLQGLAIAAFYFEKWKLPLFVRCLIYAILLLQPLAPLATAALGLFDTWFDFRRTAEKPA